jgi:hypothetical protein
MRNFGKCFVLLSALTRCAHPQAVASGSPGTAPSTSSVAAIAAMSLPAHSSNEERGIVALAQSGLPSATAIQYQRSPLSAHVTGRWQWRSAHGPRLITSVCFATVPASCVLLYSMMGEADNGERSFQAEHHLDADVRGAAGLVVDVAQSTIQRVVVRSADGRCSFSIDSRPHEGMASEGNEIGEPTCAGN